MKPEQFRRVKQLFDEICDLPEEQQQAVLRQVGDEDPLVRQELERLLAVGDPEQTSIQVSLPPRAPDLEEGTTIGPYRIERKLGEGGMGQVYEARQEEPVRRSVALKVIKHGLGSDEVLRRFEAERQALALMNHPNVARVLDAGTDSFGRPFFVMEYIEGQPITEFCDRHQLDLRRRLELFAEVCRGVQHAHQKGVIHRDLKPSNILVEDQDGTAVPRIIDFGVAKAIDQQLTERTLFTQVGQLVGTPEYMSPEQADLNANDIDTRADVYSLGVVLYELLVGRTPLETSQLRQAGFDEMRRVIREEEPSRPSQRLSTLGEGSDQVGSARRADTALLARQCRGELDWIALKALEKDRELRYESAASLGEDLRRFLSDEPVIAGPPTFRYRARKFVRRHRAAVGLFSLAAASLLVAAVGAGWGWFTATRAERQARFEAETSAEVADFLVELFEVSAPERSLGKTITARELLDRGAGRIEVELAERPDLQGRLLETIGRAYRSLGLAQDARPLLEQAVERRREAFGDSSAEVAGALNSLAGLLLLQGDPTAALPLLEEAEAIQATLGPEYEAERARTLNNLGTAHRLLGQLEPALERYRQGLELRERLFGPESLEVAKQQVNLGSVLRSLQRPTESAESYGIALEIRRAGLPPRHPDIAKVLNNLGTLYRETGRPEEARQVLDEVLEIRREVLGPEHPQVAETLASLGVVQAALGRPDQARELLEEALRIAEARLAPTHPLRRYATERLVEVLESLGEQAAADQRRRQLDSAG